MALQLLESRGRAVGAAGTVAIHLLGLALFLLLPGPRARLAPASAQIVAIDIAVPPPPPPPVRPAPAGAAPPSRGATKAPSPPQPPHPLASPTPAQVALDPGAGPAVGAGTAPGSGAGQGGEGTGSGAGGTGSGAGGGAVAPPVHLAGALTSADYRAARLPHGTAATVRVGFRVRADGAVDHCSVIGPSGFAAIDEATCRLIEQRFRFRPALDPAGNPIPWTIRTDYTWAPR